MNNKDINELWFNFYIKEIEKLPESNYKMFDDYYICPCCNFPTLSERWGFEICILCNWEDDGQDNHNADKILGWPNGNYSLTEARENFRLHLTSYRPSDKYHYERTTVKKTYNGKIILNLIDIKKEIIKKYNLLLWIKDHIERERIFMEINTLIKKL